MGPSFWMSVGGSAAVGATAIARFDTPTLSVLGAILGTATLIGRLTTLAKRCENAITFNARSSSTASRVAFAPRRAQVLIQAQRT